MPGKKHTIICLSSQRWDDPMWTNKQHIMSRLARDHRVIHVDYGLRPLPQYLYERARQRPADLLRPGRVLTDGVVRREGDLYVADAYTPLFAGAFPHGHPIRDFSTFDRKVAMLRRFIKREHIEDPIVWVYHPGYGDAVDKLPRGLLVYDCVDNYAAFPTYRDDPGWLKLREERLCRNADLVFATSSTLYDMVRPFNPEGTHLVHNVGDAEHFKQALSPSTRVPEEIASLSGPVIGFVGAVSNYKLDVDWLLAVARSRPDYNVVVIGPVGMADPSTNVGALKACSNVHLLGHREYAELPRYIKGFDVAVIPYRINSYTESVFPIKFFEFLATGKPVVVSRLPALEEFYDYVRVAATADEFVAACDAALTEPDTDQRRRVELAEANSWPARIGKIMSLIEERLEQKAARKGSAHELAGRAAQ